MILSRSFDPPKTRFKKFHANWTCCMTFIISSSYNEMHNSYLGKKKNISIMVMVNDKMSHRIASMSCKDPFCHSMKVVFIGDWGHWFSCTLNVLFSYYSKSITPVLFKLSLSQHFLNLFPYLIQTTCHPSRGTVRFFWKAAQSRMLSAY